jgi:7-cyano-7-deazaguanine synthase
MTPFQWIKKVDIIRLGLTIETPYELTWSCYEGGRLACGLCPTCVERLHAFTKVGIKDPIQYRGGE